jgi:hypothetical protein
VGVVLGALFGELDLLALLRGGDAGIKEGET